MEKPSSHLLIEKSEPKTIPSVETVDLTESVQDLKSFLEKAPLEFKEIFFDSRHSDVLQLVLTGVKPAASLDNGIFTAEVREELFKNNPQFQDEFFMDNSSIFNKRLVLKIVKENPEYFKETGDNVEEIIKNYFSPLERKEGYNNHTYHLIPHVQIGLLLGYPKIAAKYYADTALKRAKGKIFFLQDLQNKIPSDNPDAKILEGLLQKEIKYINTHYGQAEDIPSRPLEIYPAVKELFEKYWPPDIAQASGEIFCNEMASIFGRGGEGWKEDKRQKDEEGELLKAKYRHALYQLEVSGIIQQLKDNFCLELVNENVKKDIQESKEGLLYRDKLQKIQNLVSQIKSLVSTTYENLLAVNFNSFDGKQIETAQDLIEFLSALSEVYKNPVNRN